MTELEQARARFAADKYATETTGIELEAVGEGFARCGLLLDARHYNAVGSVMGGVLFTLADFAFAVAANHGLPPTVSLSTQAAFVRAPRGKRLSAEARCVRRGQSTCFYQVEVTDEDGGIVAIVGISGFIKTR